MNLLKCCQHKMFKAARSSAEMACGKNASNLIQLPLTVVLSLFCPCFLKIGLRGGMQGHTGCVYCRWYRRSGPNFTSLYPITYSGLQLICSLSPLNWFLHIAQLRFVPDPKAGDHFLQGFSWPVLSSRAPKLSVHLSLRFLHLGATKRLPEKTWDTSCCLQSKILEIPHSVLSHSSQSLI